MAAAAAAAAARPLFALPRTCLPPSAARTRVSQPRLDRLAAAVRRPYSTGPNPTPGRSPLRVWPFVLITLSGSVAYVLLVKSRAGTDSLQDARGVPRGSASLQSPLSPPPRSRDCRPDG